MSSTTPSATAPSNSTIGIALIAWNPSKNSFSWRADAALQSWRVPTKHLESQVRLSVDASTHMHCLYIYIFRLQFSSFIAKWIPLLLQRTRVLRLIICMELMTPFLLTILLLMP